MVEIQSYYSLGDPTIRLGGVFVAAVVIGNWDLGLKMEMGT